jgi:hypothetical protein
VAHSADPRDRPPVFVLPFPARDLVVAWCEADHNQLEA